MANMDAPFVVNCKACRHEWAPLFLPMEVTKVVEISNNAKCPACGCGEMYVGFAPKEETKK